MFDLDIDSLKGKTTIKIPKVVSFVPYTLLPEIKSQYQGVTLCPDIMKVDGIPSFDTKSRNITFRSTDHIHIKRR